MNKLVIIAILTLTASVGCSDGRSALEVKPGSTVTMKVLRDGRTTELKATLDESRAAEAGRRSIDGEREGGGRFGMTVEPLTPELAGRLDVDRDVKGVLITEIDPAGVAAAAGLREGDVIQQVNGRAVRSAAEIRDALSAASDKPAVLLVTRGNETIFIPLRGR